MCHSSRAFNSKLEFNNIGGIDLNDLPSIVAQKVNSDQLRLETIAVIKDDGEISCVIHIKEADLVHILSFIGERKCDGATIFVVVGFSVILFDD